MRHDEPMTTSIFVSRPTSGDVVDLILEDHRLFEDLLRECRRTDRDRLLRRIEARAAAEVEIGTVQPELLGAGHQDPGIGSE